MVLHPPFSFSQAVRTWKARASKKPWRLESAESFQKNNTCVNFPNREFWNGGTEKKNCYMIVHGVCVVPYKALFVCCAARQWTAHVSIDRAVIVQYTAKLHHCHTALACTVVRPRALMATYTVRSFVEASRPKQSSKGSAGTRHDCTINYNYRPITGQHGDCLRCHWELPMSRIFLIIAGDILCNL